MAIPTVFSQVLSLGHHETFHRLLVAILKKTLKLKPSLPEILQVISVTPFYKVPIPELFEQFNRDSLTPEITFDDSLYKVDLTARKGVRGHLLVSSGDKLARLNFPRNPGTQFTVRFAQVAVRLQPTPPAFGESEIAI